MAFGYVSATEKPLISSSFEVKDGGGKGRRSGSVGFREMGRRNILSSALLVSTTATIPAEADSKKALIQKYLKKSEENKAQNDKKRLDDYYKRNYKDYFEFIEGSLKGKKEELTEAEKGILDWLQSNK